MIFAEALNQAGNFWAYVGAGYGACAAVLIAYSARTITRAPHLPPASARSTAVDVNTNGGSTNSTQTASLPSSI